MILMHIKIWNLPIADFVSCKLNRSFCLSLACHWVLFVGLSCHQFYHIAVKKINKSWLETYYDKKLKQDVPLCEI